jgi:alpha-tubulin suppressor-like RCC1 family protein
MALGLAWLWLVALLFVIAGCEGKHHFAPPIESSGDTETSGLLPGAPDTGEAPVGEPGALGAACADTSECDAPGLCVDGVCCSTACTELCAACNLPGTLGSCSAAPSDAACAPVICPSEGTECRPVDTSQLAINCESFGQCRTQGECASLPQATGTPCQGETGTCDGAGACLVAGKAVLGAACAEDADCAETHCVGVEGGAKVCCDAACDGLCQACSSAGRCETVPAADLRCEDAACPADNVCIDYTELTTASQCRAFGQCKTPIDCIGTQLLPAGQCACDVQGCTLKLGVLCTGNDQCGSGACVAAADGSSVCCANACGAGLFCASDGSGCVACEGDRIDCTGNVEQRCAAGALSPRNCPNGCTPGMGCNAEPPVGFLCESGRCAAPGVCQIDVSGASRCCSRDCAAEGKVCTTSGSCACAEGQLEAGGDCLFQPGDPCDTNDQCESGSCVDNVCCQEACSGACEVCQSGTGACVPVARGQQDPLCSGGRECVGARGDCRSRLRQPCTNDAANAECSSGSCEPAVGNVGSFCCAQECTGAQSFCRSDGSACTQCETNAECGNGCNTLTGLCNPLLNLGSGCGSTAQCANNAVCLVDQNGATRCCESNCGAGGQVCVEDGRCACPVGLVLRSGNCLRVPVSVSAGGAASCALFTDGTVECWGDNSNGQLGTQTLEFVSPSPVPVAGLARVRSVSVGDGTICALIDPEGSVRCLGSNFNGRLGNGSTDPSSVFPVQVTGITGAVAISVGGPHSCAVISDGSIRCWGSNQFGALGNGQSGGFSSTPVAVANLGGSATAVAADSLGFKTCAVLRSGTVQCWGLHAGESGILGDGTFGTGNELATRPITVSGITTAIAVEVENENTCALLSNGAVRCWGDNDNGALGDGTTNQALTPVAVAGLTGVVTLSMQQGTGCVATGGGGVQCWGDNLSGGLGTGSTSPFSLAPVNVPGLTGVRSIAAGLVHACAIGGDDIVRCWGLNQASGQLGDGTFDNSNVPVAVVGL